MANALRWQAGLILLAQAAHADCAAPQGDFQTTICADPGLKAQLEEIETSTARTLEGVSDPILSKAFRTSVRHRFEAYEVSWDYAKSHPEDSGTCNGTPSSCAKTWFTRDWLSDRLDDISQMAADQNALGLLREEILFRRSFTGGVFGHDDAMCWNIEPWIWGEPQDRLFCSGSFRIQHHDRICRPRWSGTPAISRSVWASKTWKTASPC